MERTCAGMAKNERNGQAPYSGIADTKHYKEAIRHLQIELVKVQRHVVETGSKILIVFEGRDTAGKDGTIRRFVKYLNPRETRVVALAKPSVQELSQWYFQRYVKHLPSAGEMVFFNRSWYNRAGVEKVMGFCSDDEYEEFMTTVPYFEQMLRHAGIHLFKYYLDIDRHEQETRLEARRDNPLKQWKMSAMDGVALAHWDDYSLARNQMFLRTSSPESPWIIVKADNKKLARMNLIQHFLMQLEYPGKKHEILHPDPDIVFPFLEDDLHNGRIAP
ncbi:MAG: polyphosphate kinase 2 [Sulfobacillus thermosulfidooxidans]|uniref:ADP/GDP-polyphosphate phosphotransferase n=1 Tax=Sulfobacillus thermosulfidooxidans TaxID=28034 RepID=A0A2T2WVY6_SULTH|nr:MAG: polyphosphate kinase 2 [Sulfobacillus thermosulfidooxidans]